VFFTQDGDDDLRNAAMQVQGAAGHVIKAEAAQALVSVISAA